MNHSTLNISHATKALLKAKQAELNGGKDKGDPGFYSLDATVRVLLAPEKVLQPVNTRGTVYGAKQ